MELDRSTLTIGLHAFVGGGLALVGGYRVVSLGQTVPGSLNVVVGVMIVVFGYLIAGMT